MKRLAIILGAGTSFSILFFFFRKYYENQKVDYYLFHCIHSRFLGSYNLRGGLLELISVSTNQNDQGFYCNSVIYRKRSNSLILVLYF